MGKTQHINKNWFSLYVMFKAHGVVGGEDDHVVENDHCR
jgi:hypothetical protein